MASEVPQIKNPKTIMVKPNYAKIIKMIGPITTSGEQIVKPSLWIVQGCVRHTYNDPKVFCFFCVKKYENLRTGKNQPG